MFLAQTFIGLITGAFGTNYGTRQPQLGMIAIVFVAVNVLYIMCTMAGYDASQLKASLALGFFAVGQFAVKITELT